MKRLQLNIPRQSRLAMAFTLAVVCVLLPSVLAAQPGDGFGSGHGMKGQRHGGGAGFGHRGGHSIGDRIEHLADALELSDSQRTQIESIIEAHKGQVEPIHSALRDAHEVISEARGAEAIDEAAVRDAFASAGQAKADLFFAHQGVQESVHAVLTPAQLEQLEEMKDHRQERRERSKQRRHERREHRRQGHGSDGN